MRCFDDSRLAALQVFERCKAMGDSVAIVDQQEKLNYTVLRERIWSYYTAVLEVEDELVGIADDPSADSYALILALQMAGKCYVPLDLKLPEERLKRMLATLSLRSIVCTEGKLINFPEFLSNKIFVVALSSGLQEGKAAELLQTCKFIADKPSYLIFTSGTTAAPKGAMISQGNLNAYLNEVFSSAEYDFTSADRFLQAYTLSFDASIRWIYIPLLVGGTVYIPDRRMPVHIDIMRLLIEEKLSVCMILPSILYLMKPFMSELAFPYLRWSIFGGEPLYESVLKNWSRLAMNATFENYYGPTELTQSCFRYRWKKGEVLRDRNSVVSIGMPHSALEPLLEGEQGTERGYLCVKGPQVFMGYFPGMDGVGADGYYNTGDIVSRDTDGYYYFEGRADTEVKLNGYRVNLQEIESALLRCSDAGKFAVLKRKTADGYDYLQVYMDIDTKDEHSLPDKLKKILPEYMLPKSFVKIDEWPYLSNGKLDRKALQEREEV